MSNMLHKGKRIAARAKKKQTKHDTKEFYKILGDLDEVADILKDDKELTEENLKEKAQAVSNREIKNMEVFILKGKLGLYETMENELSKEN